MEGEGGHLVSLQPESEEGGLQYAAVLAAASRCVHGRAGSRAGSTERTGRQPTPQQTTQKVVAKLCRLADHWLMPDTQILISASSEALKSKWGAALGRDS